MACLAHGGAPEVTAIGLVDLDRFKQINDRWGMRQRMNVCASRPIGCDGPELTDRTHSFAVTGSSRKALDSVVCIQKTDKYVELRWTVT
jgi:hypothetical protein